MYYPADACRRSVGTAEARQEGKRLQVSSDDPGLTLVKGRSKAAALEIDGTVHPASRRPLRPGDIVSVKIERAETYDLCGVAV